MIKRVKRRITECRLPALKKTLKRQSSAGNIALLLIAVWVLYPYVVDRFKGEPYIASYLEVTEIGGDFIVKDTVKVNHPNRGTRTNYVLDIQGRIMCSRTWAGYWNESKFTTWYLGAYAGCEKPPKTFKVCTMFLSRTKSGIERKFGGDFEFCTPYVYTDRGHVNG